MIIITRIYSDEKGETHFEDKEMPLINDGDIGFLSKKIPVREIIFRTVKSEYDYDFHNAPQKQYVILLDGAIEIETSLGEKRNFKGGDVLLLEDTEGKGHKTKNLQAIARRSIFITL